MNKVIFIDIDGTLRNDNQEITDRTKKAIENIKTIGYEIVICTGRAADFSIKINNLINNNRYIIFNNGAGILDVHNNKILFENKMNNSSIIKLFNMVNPLGVRCILASNGTRYVNKLKHTDGSEQLIEGPLEDFLNKNNVIQFTISSIDLELMKNIRGDIDKIEDIKIINTSRDLIDSKYPTTTTPYYNIANFDSSKGNGIKHFCEMFNINKEDTIGIGDDKNDIQMFEECGYKVAMGNALPDLKDIADYVTDDNNNDGVAKFLEKLYEEKKDV